MVPPDTSSEAPAPAATPTAATSPGPEATTPPTSPAAKEPTPAWAEWLTATASSLYAWLMRPRVRLTVTGAMLLLVGVLIASNTVWTLPLVIIGALMVAVAWMGHRLDGRFALEWGEAGTQLAFRATIKAPQAASEVPALAVAARSADDVIEGEAHTVEINVTELKALIAAAEAAEAAEAVPAAEPENASVRDIRIRRLADEPDRTPRPAG